MSVCVCDCAAQSSVAQLAVLAHHTSPIVKRLQDAARTRRRLRESAHQLTFEDLLLAMLLRKDKNKKKAMADDAPLKPDTSTHASAAATSRTESLGCCHPRKAAQPLERQSTTCIRVALAEHLPILDSTATSYLSRSCWEKDNEPFLNVLR